MWVGHATVLLSMEGEGGRRFNILTDPVFSDRIGVTLGPRTFGLRRLSRPAITESMLPPIDVVLLSHAHFDHLDRPTLRRLAMGAARGATVVTAARTSRLVPAGFKNVLELPWSHAIDVGPLRIDAIRPAHWGARTAIDRRRGFNSYVLHSNGRRVLFAGDTAATDAFERIGPVDLSIFGVGAYEPWEHAHATPEQVWAMFRHLRGNDGKLLPMHHSTFDLGEERPGEPLARLEAAAGSAWQSVVCRELGECFSSE
jgi:L-ascorbate metabolism protein UlaG (beta-lactamase superfamily)